LPYHHGLLNGATAGASAVEAPHAVAMTVERLDPALNLIVPEKPVLEKVATGPGFKWTVGPVWIRDGYLLFAGINRNSLSRWEPCSGVSFFIQPSVCNDSAPYTCPEPGPNCITLDSHGRLTGAGHAPRDVWR